MQDSDTHSLRILWANHFRTATSVDKVTGASYYKDCMNATKKASNSHLRAIDIWKTKRGKR